ncbi:aminoglycoside phosphotransferase family protein [Actinoplanes bogorensis]|uniref:Aminoglycoside phosphotransferase family protein n=1 Tax=Paractinoplanes bogorensis TaxID=1610840 RepID=A0ABS5YM55_9ACTN|nr:aminoglycoside phosphotransferase family protein [Actinoplanes bogorensis]MBU2664539.1 aminoglycoside phosphotransferase family protein [Actinoplanes bogorensis]
MEITTSLVRTLVDRQFPQWTDRPLTLVDPAGSDHVIHRLGDDFSVRLPRHAGAVDQAKLEFEWLPRLAPHLPLAIPSPVAVGEPDLGYPWHWSVSRWLEGSVATVDDDSPAVAVALADFLLALQSRPTGSLGSGRPLGDRDAAVREAITQVAGVFDAGALTEVWEAALAAPAWDRPPVCFHGDFHSGNLLTAGGRVTAVIDFGGLGAGDPARDLMMPFTLMSAANRTIFRDRLGVDDATWARGRGWNLAGGLNAYCSYAAVSPRVAAATTRQITAALAG